MNRTEGSVLETRKRDLVLKKVALQEIVQKLQKDIGTIDDRIRAIMALQFEEGTGNGTR